MRQFADILRDLPGTTYDELGDAVAEIVAAVVEQRKAGQLTLTLKVKPNGENSVLVTPDIKSVVPKPTRMDGVFFTNQAGDMFRENPAQMKMPLRAVAEETGEVQTPHNPETGEVMEAADHG